MRIRIGSVILLAAILAGFPVVLRGRSQATATTPAPSAHEPAAKFRTSDRCVACHNGLLTSSGEDISIGFQWRASIMANSSRDPYWQGSVRRESIDHPESKAAIENECSTCHMPVRHLEDKEAGHKTEVFAHLPLQMAPKGDRAAADGVSCSVCHQVANIGLGTPATFNGNVAIEKAVRDDLRPEFGPFETDLAHQTIMRSSTGGFVPTQGHHISDPGLCGTCHTLYTKALGPHGEEIGTFPEQMPFKEWQHSDYESRNRQTCQQCHMPRVEEPVAITALYGQPREGMRRHVFVGANFVMEGMLHDHRDELSVEALPQEMDGAMQRTTEFMRTQAAKVTIRGIDATPDGLAINVFVQNLSGHKLPTAYPSRRAWLHVVVRDANGRIVFESGALNADGSIVGNDNDQDPLRFEPHYREITNSQQVEIYEPILKDSQGKITTGLLNAVGYLKDNRLLPSGFDKATADKDIAVTGDAADDPGFTDKGSQVRYVVSTANASGPFKVEAELWYQPIGFRWAHNLAPYRAAEPERMLKYYEQAARQSAMVIARAEASR